jgi:hypothetical protein
VPVSISTNEMDVSVKLQVTYNTVPSTYQSATLKTDVTGNVTLPWHVSVSSSGKNVVAKVIAIAIDQNGHSMQSKSITVQVVTA